MTEVLLKKRVNRTDEKGRLLLSREEFVRMHEEGIFSPEDKLELLRGEIYHKMTMLGPHIAALYNALQVMTRLFQPNYRVLPQVPLSLNENDLPEPDISIVDESSGDLNQGPPSDAVLVIEISDSTLRKDRGLKAAIYAEAGIEEYWIVNLVDRVLEVHRQPGALPSDPSGFGYRSITRFSETDRISPLALPEASILVSELLN